MDIIGAAALIAVGIVLAALVYGRTHPAARPAAAAVNPAPTADLETELRERRVALARREDALDKREVELEHEREALSASARS